MQSPLAIYSYIYANTVLKKIVWCRPCLDCQLGGQDFFPHPLTCEAQHQALSGKRVRSIFFP